MAFHHRGDAGDCAGRGRLFLSNRPTEAGTLADRATRRRPFERLTAEQQRERIRHFALGGTLRNPRVRTLTSVYFGRNVTGYGFVLFLPRIVKQFGLTDVQTGFVPALPFIGALIGIFLWAGASDRTGAKGIDASVVVHARESWCS